MPQQPRSSIEDAFIEGRPCLICGRPALAVVHLDDFPDYISCAECGAAFVLEDGGDRAMYGSIPSAFRETRGFALKQWAALEAIEALAEAERAGPDATAAASSAAEDELAIQEPEETAPSADDGERPTEEPGEVEPPQVGGALSPVVEEGAAEPFPVEDEPVLEATREAEALPGEDEEMQESAAAPDDGVVEVPPFMVSDEEEGIELSEQAEEAPSSEAQEPPPGRRYRVRHAGTEPLFPTRTCAHCMTVPAKRRLIIVGAVANRHGEISRGTFTLPLCRACHDRARARSEEARNARLLAHLSSVLMGFVLMVVSLALGVVTFQERPFIDAALLGLLALIGYGFPAWLLLGRASRFPPPADALYVRSTLMVAPQANAGETIFDWRSSGYAQIFRQANSSAAIGEVTEVPDRFPKLGPEGPQAAPSSEQ